LVSKTEFLNLGILVTNFLIVVLNACVELVDVVLEFLLLGGILGIISPVLLLFNGRFVGFSIEFPDLLLFDGNDEFSVSFIGLKLGISDLGVVCDASQRSVKFL